jgi:hypothetical protein
MLYDRAHYEYRCKFAKSHFEKNCLTKYAEIFKTVCVDAAYYKFPDEKYLSGLVSQVPADFNSPSRRRMKSPSRSSLILRATLVRVLTATFGMQVIWIFASAEQVMRFHRVVLGRRGADYALAPS